MSHHTLAVICLVGTTLDLLGGLYLAYDLLGGQHGPLRLLSRIVTYSVIFCLFYGLGLGLLFAVAAGLTTGITLAFELNRVALGKPHYPIAGEAFCSVLRGLGFAVGLYPQHGLRFALPFALLSVVGQVIAYRRGMRPSIDYRPDVKPHITRSQWQGTLVRTAGYVAAALLCSFFSNETQGALLFALRVGLTTGFATGFGILFVPVVEFYADHLPERRMGVFGLCLILSGFFLQSIQYWVVVFDVRLS